MRRAATLLLVALVAAFARPADARRGGGRAARGEVMIEGEQTDVRWTDGDTFRVLSGRHSGQRVRLAGVNALETFGPVHRIGGTGGWELLAIAKESASIAAAAGGRCEMAASGDRYGRRVARCPEVAEALVRTGHAMVFAVDAPPDAALLRLQREAQRRRAGMWAGGAPRLIPTGLHSADERDLGPRGAYDRVVDTRNGHADVRRHARVYETCEEVCLGQGEDRACMIYVPFEIRYRSRPACLRRPASARGGRDPDPLPRWGRGNGEGAGDGCR